MVPDFDGIGIMKMNISCHYTHLTPTEDIRSKSSIAEQNSILRVTRKTQHHFFPCDGIKDHILVLPPYVR